MVEFKTWFNTKNLKKSAILLTGNPGCGKTTVICRFLENYRGPAGGFFTREIRSSGVRTGFELVTLDGQRGVFAHTDISVEPRVGKYGVDIDVLDKLGVNSINNAMKQHELIVIDEIGPMELKSRRFREAVWNVVRVKAPVLGSIMLRSNPFAEKIKRRSEVQLLTVNSDNRHVLPMEILDQIVKLFPDEYPGTDEF